MSAGFSRVQLLELGHVGKSALDSLAAGASPLQVLGFEGGRLLQVIQGSGGLKGAFLGLAELVGGPWVLAAGAAVGATALISNQFRAAHEAAEVFGKGIDAATGAEVGHTKAAETLSAALAQLNKDSHTYVLTAREQIAADRELTVSKQKLAIEARNALGADLAAAQARLQTSTNGRSSNFGGIAVADTDLARVTALIQKNNADLRQAQSDIGKSDRGTQWLDVLEQTEAKTNAVAAATTAFKNAEQKVKEELIAGKITREQAADADLRLARARDAAIQSARDAKKVDRSGIGDAKVAARREDGVQQSIAQLELEASLAGQIKETRGAELKIFELEKAAHRELSAAEQERVRRAYDVIEARKREQIAIDAIVKGQEAALKGIIAYADALAKTASIKIGKDADLATYGSANPTDASDLIKRFDPTVEIRQRHADDVAGIKKSFVGPEQDRLLKAEAERFGQELEDAGKRAAKGFGDAGVQAATAIGDAIGGRAGAAISKVASLYQFSKTGDIGALQGSGGIGSAAAALSKIGGGKEGSFGQDFSTQFRSTITDAFKPNTDATKNLTDFLGGEGNGSFAKVAGQAFAGASVGDTVSGITKAIGLKSSKVGGEIGGAIGSFIPIPGGQIIGAIAGSLLGGLFQQTRKASATLDVSGGTAQAGNVVGTDQAIKEAAKGGISAVGNNLNQIAAQLGGLLDGTSHVSIGIGGSGRYRVDTTGKGSTDKNGTTVIGFGNDEQAAISFATVTAIKQGVITGLSAKVQAAIKSSDDITTALNNALRVKSLEDALNNAKNPFSSVLRDEAVQAQSRLDIGRKFGFDVVAVEKYNADSRSKLIKDSLSQSTSSIKSLLDDLKFGDKAEGSFGTRRAALVAERDRVAALAQTGDADALNQIATISAKLLDLDKQGYGATANYAQSRDQTTTLLNSLVQQTQDRIDAADKAAQAQVNPQLTEANASLDDIAKAQAQQLGLLAGLPANIAAAIASGQTSSAALTAYYTRRGIA